MTRPLRQCGATAVAALTLAVAACGPGSGPIRIGLAGPLSAPIGQPMLEAARLAVEQINAEGGINGRLVELVERDDYGTADSAVQVAADLVRQDVVAIVGHGQSAPTLAAAPLYEGAASPVPLVVPWASSPAIADAGEYVFRVCPSDLVHGTALAQYARDEMHLERVSVMYLNDAYGRGVRRTFTERFQALGGQVVEALPYLGTDPDMEPFLRRLAAQGVSQAIIFAGFRGEAESILRQMQALELQLPFLGGDAINGIADAGPLADGVIYSTGYQAFVDTPANRQFLDAYRRRWPESPVPNHRAAGTYDALLLLRDVLRTTRTTRRAVRDGLAQVGRSATAYRGVLGPVAFDAQGEPGGDQTLIVRVQDGTVTLATGPGQ